MAETSQNSSKLFCTDYDKRGQASCKKCKTKISKGSFRIGKLVSNPFSESGGAMKHWYHPSCIFEMFAAGRTTSARISAMADVDGVKELSDADKDSLKTLIENLDKQKKLIKPKTTPRKDAKVDSFFAASPSKSPLTSSRNDCPDGIFTTFCKLCERITAEPSYKNKTQIINDFLYRKGATNKHGYCGDTFVLLRLLLPGEKGIERVYNLNNKQLIKIFADILGADSDSILSKSTEHGDISVVIADGYFRKSQLAKPANDCTLTLEDVDKFLDSLTNLTKIEEQTAAFRKICKQTGIMELRYIIRLLKKDLRMNAKASQVLAGVSDKAYEAFQHSRNLKAICSFIGEVKSPSGSPGLKKDISVKANIMQPIQPMLAEACKSIDFAFSRCNNGMFAEIKYDGERVQVHHSGKNFNYYSRSLKPVLPHKVSYLSEAIPKAFPGTTDLILDGEIVLVDTGTHLPLPFGTLGIHKKKAFKSAQVCLFIFDCMYMNGKSLMNKSVTERRKALSGVMTEIPDRIVLSEVHHITKRDQLHQLLDHVFTEGLEGLVLKPVNSSYEPGKRHWLKMKKDYLDSGAMADTADLIVLGAYFGSGSKGGMMSIFLMGVFDSKQKRFLTVTKCSNGHDDATLARLQKELDMTRINKDVSKVPSWLVIKNSIVPDFVVKDPKKAPIWEITGAEFSRAEVHTADGISIRFPRVTRIRDDKDWQSATSLEELNILKDNSRQQAPAKLVSSVTLAKSPTKRAKPALKIQSEDSDDDTDSTIPLGEDEVEECKVEKIKTPSPVKKPKKGHSPIASSSSLSVESKRTDWNPSDIFMGCTFYFDKLSPKLRRCVIAYGADAICDSASDVKVTHHIVADECSSVPSEYNGHAKVARVAWISSCVKAKSLLSNSSYFLN